MTRTSRDLSWMALGALLLVALVPPVVAQDGDADDDDISLREEYDLFGVFIEASVWIAKPNGLGYRPAIQLSAVDDVGGTLLPFEYSTETEDRWRAGYQFPGDNGGLIGSYYAHRQDNSRTESTPGIFQFGEIQAFPPYAGFFDDGLADGFAAEAQSVIRDVRIDYYRDIIRNRTVAARWTAGFRRVQHNRRMDVVYLGLVPEGIPAGFVPGFDDGLVESKFTGRGVGIGLDVEFPFAKRFMVESGISLAALFGDIDAQYRSNTNELILTPDTENVGEFIFSESPRRAVVDQKNVSTSSSVLETYVGIRARVWRTLELFIDYRLAHYDNVGLDLSVSGATFEADTGDSTVLLVNGQDIDETARSVTYEGVQLGVGYTF